MFGEGIEPVIEEDILIEIPLWPTKQVIFEIYRILYPFCDGDLRLDTQVMLTLIKDAELPLQISLVDITAIHNGFKTVVGTVYGGFDNDQNP